MTVIIDRRKNPSGKNHINRQRFLNRARDQIKKTVHDSVADKNLRDIGKNEKVIVNQRDVAEPTFHNDQHTGDRKRVLPGNKDFDAGDRITKPKKHASGGGNGNSAGDQDSFDEFEFSLTRDEFLDYLFDDLELPDFIKTSIQTTTTTKHVRQGLTAHGSPANLNVLRTYKNSMARRNALARPTDELIASVQQQIEQANDQEKPALEEYLQQLINRQKQVPFIDDTDLKYNLWQKLPQPQSLNSRNIS